MRRSQIPHLFSVLALATFALPLQSFGQEAPKPAPVTAPAATEDVASPRDLRDLVRSADATPEAKQEAFDQLVAFSKDGNGDASLYLGDFYRTGQFVTADENQSMQAYQAALDAGKTAAATRLGDIYLRGTVPGLDAAQAVKFYDIAGKAGDERALQKLGDLYRDGKIVTQDGAKAADYYQQALTAGLATAALRLGDLYRDGADKGLDPAQAIGVYKAQADTGDTAAMLRLGDAYRDGKGTAADPAQAATYYRAALDAGADGAFNRLVNLYVATPATAPQGIALLEQAVADGKTDAARSLAEIYLKGAVAAADVTKAIGILQAASDKGDTAAGRRLVRLYVDGKGKLFPRDLGKARTTLAQIGPALEPAVLFRETLAIDGATAQSASAMQSVLERFKTLDGETKSGLAGQMAQVNPNVYVLLLQDHLMQAGLYSGTLTGQLTQRTISAFNALCASRDAAASCSAGPLSGPARRLFRDVLEAQTGA